MQVKTSGMFKQDFITKRVLNEEIIVHPNIRVQRQIITHLDGIKEELIRLESVPEDSYLVENLRYLLELIDKLSPT